MRAPPLQGWKAPPLTHKFSMLSQKPFEAFNGGREWRVDGSMFPISTAMTGVVLEMEPGALRELHWHPNAAEWQYVLSGQFNVTMFGSQGRCRRRPSARATSATSRKASATPSKTSAEKARILIVFNNGHYQTIDVSQWIAGNPIDILATNFSQDPGIFEKFPRRDVFLTK